MRKYCTDILREQFRINLIQSRSAADISQEEMARRLMMALRSYVDLESGRNCCGAVTLVLYLVYLCPDPLEFLADFQEMLEKFMVAV